MMIEAIENCRIPLGYAGEHLVTAVQFDKTGWVEEYGAGSFQLVHRRHGETDALPTAIEYTPEGVVTWTLSDADTAVKGVGECQLIFETQDGRIRKSEVWWTVTGRSLTSSEEIPSPMEGWVGQVLQASADADAAAERSAASAAAAEAARTAAETAAATFETDKTLSVSGKAADAKISGLAWHGASATWSQGGINSATGASNSTASANRIRSGYLPGNVLFLHCAEGYKYMLFAYDADKTYLGTWNGAGFEKSGNWLTGLAVLPDLRTVPCEIDGTAHYPALFRLTFACADDAALTPDAGSNMFLEAVTDDTLTAAGRAADAAAVRTGLRGFADVVLTGSYVSTASAQIFRYYDVAPGETYRLYVWNRSGMQSDIQPRLYRFNTDGDYVEIKVDEVTGSGGYIYNVKIPAGVSPDYLRLYANKAAAAETVSCDYALVKVRGSIVDTLEDRIGEIRENHNDRLYKNTYKIFRKVVCCGDSYTSGYFVDKNGTAHSSNPNYAWPHYMETMSGNIWYNCSKHGTNSLTWQTDSECLPKAQASGKTQAYVLGLGLNDEAQGTSRYVPVGTAADIGTAAETYYGGMSAIIRALAAISPDAHIFVNTNPNIAYTGNANRDAAPYNAALRDIVSAYEGSYHVHLIDLAGEYLDLYNVPSILNDVKSSHFTPQGYEQFAEIYAYVLSDYINRHYDQFQDVALIEFDE